VSARRIATTTRGGYCYHLNGALGLLLSSLGYDVHGHVGSVYGPAGQTPDEIGNHLALTVRGLPAEDNPAGVWYVDTGLGDALHEPLPLLAGQYLQPPFRLTLETTSAGWHLVHDPGGGFRGMYWTPGEAVRSDFEARHVQLSTSPQSGFVKVPMAERRDATGVDVVRGLVRMRIGDGARTDEPVSGEREYFAVLADVLGLSFDASPAGTRERLWTAAQAAHRAWAAGQG
jgi:arylamine N-acetyltransferase